MTSQMAFNRLGTSVQDNLAITPFFGRKDKLGNFSLLRTGKEICTVTGAVTSPPVSRNSQFGFRQVKS
jgi:hypothetical protein